MTLIPTTHIQTSTGRHPNTQSPSLLCSDFIQTISICHTTNGGERERERERERESWKEWMKTISTLVHGTFCLIFCQGEVEIQNSNSAQSKMQVDIDKSGRSEAVNELITFNQTLFDVGQGLIFVLQVVSLVILYWYFSRYIPLHSPDFLRIC